jgi:hypothetical protein
MNRENAWLLSERPARTFRKDVAKADSFVITLELVPENSPEDDPLIR